MQIGIILSIGFLDSFKAGRHYPCLMHNDSSTVHAAHAAHQTPSGDIGQQGDLLMDAVYNAPVSELRIARKLMPRMMYKK